MKKGGSLAFSRLSILLIILSFVDIFRDFNLQPGPFFASLVNFARKPVENCFLLPFFSVPKGIILCAFSPISTIFLMYHTRKYNFDISGESNQRNKFVKCFEHYFSGGKFIVYVQRSPPFIPTFSPPFPLHRHRSRSQPKPRQ
jgi:hypothetical protein